MITPTISIKCLLLLAVKHVVFQGTQSHQTIWTNTFINVNLMINSGNVDLQLSSTRICSIKAAVLGLYFFCGNDEDQCILLNFNPLMSYSATTSSPGWHCFTQYPDPLCLPPFFKLDGVGCVFLNTENLVPWTNAQSTCPTGSYFWYPKTDAERALMTDYLTNTRFGQSVTCGPSYPYADEKPGACQAKVAGNAQSCCEPTGLCTVLDPCNCAGCVDYATSPKIIWVSLHRINTQWTFGDGRILHDNVGSLPWGPVDPKNLFNCAGYFYAPFMNTVYLLSDVPCTTAASTICFKA